MVGDYFNSFGKLGVKLFIDNTVNIIIEPAFVINAFFVVTGRQLGICSAGYGITSVGLLYGVKSSVSRKEVYP